MIAIVGGLLAALGLFAGTLLLAAPLGLVVADTSVVLGLLFPVLTVMGWFLMIIGDRRPGGLVATRILAGLLLLLALCAAAALVAAGAGFVTLRGVSGSLPVWVVMILGGVVGAVGTAAVERRPQPDPAA